MIRSTSSPAIRPASLVAWRWESLKYAGTVITALVTVSPRWRSAVSFIFLSTAALIWEGAFFSPRTSTQASPLSARTILYGTMSTSLRTTGSSNRRPISRLTAKTVFSGLVTAWRLAGMPTRVSPSSVNATMDGVVRMPSSFSITRAFLPSMIATQLFVVPRSMPMILLLMPHSLTPEAGVYRDLKPVRGDRWRQSHAAGRRVGPSPCSEGSYKKRALALQAVPAREVARLARRAGTLVLVTEG